MNDIIKYDIVNPIPDKSLPFVNKGILYFPIEENYKYFLEASQDNVYGGKDYFILLGKVKFSQHCRLCHTDMYRRVKLKLKGEVKEYVNDVCESKGNINIEYVESTDTYDVFSIE